MVTKGVICLSWGGFLGGFFLLFVSLCMSLLCPFFLIVLAVLSIPLHDFDYSYPVYVVV